MMLHQHLAILLYAKSPKSAKFPVDAKVPKSILLTIAPGEVLSPPPNNPRVLDAADPPVNLAAS